MEAGAQQRPDTLELIKKYFGPLVAGLLVARVVSLFTLTALFIPIRTDITFPEGALVARAMDVAQGRVPYHDWRQWPHAFAPYPPLAYYPAGWIARAAGAQNDPYTIYMVGRSVSLAALAGIFVMIFLLGRRLGLGVGWSLAAASLLGQFPALLEYCGSYRPDAPKTFFALLALWIMARHKDGTGSAGVLARSPEQMSIRIALALLCLIVSAWFKPTAWGIGLVLVVGLWLRLGWRRGLIAMAAFVAVGAAPLLLLDRLWDGRLLLNIVGSLDNGLTLDGFRRNAAAAHLAPLGVAIAGCLVAIKGLGVRGEGRVEEKLILAAVPVSMLAGLAQFFKVGSDINYFLDGYPLAALALTWGAARVWRGEVRWPAGVRNALIGLVLIPVPLVLAALDLSVMTDAFVRVNPAARPGEKRVTYFPMTALWSELPVQYLARRVPGPILATNPFIQLTHPAEPAIMDYFQYGILVRRGRIDPRPLLDRLRERRFQAVIISEPILDMTRKDGGREADLLYSREFLPTLLAHYRLERRVAIFFVYVPR